MVVGQGMHYNRRSFLIFEVFYERPSQSGGYRCGRQYFTATEVILKWRTIGDVYAELEVLVPYSDHQLPTFLAKTLILINF